MSNRKATSHPLHRRYHNFKNMCYNPNNHHYEWYGARGLDVYEEWRDSFWAFADWVDENLGPVPFPDAHLDRIDNDIGYHPGNLVWHTARENYNNKRDNLMITHNGKTDTLANWAREVGVEARTIWSRINDYGYSPEDAFSVEKYKHRK